MQGISLQAELVDAGAIVDCLVIHAPFFAEPLRDVFEYLVRQISAEAKVLINPANDIRYTLAAGAEQDGKRRIHYLLFRHQDLASLDGLDLTALAEGYALRNRAQITLVLCPGWEPSEQLVAAIREFCAGHPLLRFVDARRSIEAYAVGEISSGEQNVLLPYTRAAYAAIGLAMARSLASSVLPRLKMVVVDCDDTLWAGECGEIPAEELHLDEAHLVLQRKLVDLHQCGTLIAVCSKNDFRNVENVFRLRSEFALRFEHIAAWKVGWRPKSEGVTELIRQFGIGSDAVLFIDNDPFECNEVLNQCTGVSAVTLSGSVEQRRNLLEHCWALDSVQGTKQDKVRLDWYRRQAQGAHEPATPTDVPSFLEQVGFVATVRSAEQDDLPRVAQLTSRTNQFNNGASPLQPATLLTVLDGGKGRCWVVTAADKFGDYGTIATAIGSRIQNTLSIRNICMSCRALTRHVEDTLAVALAHSAVEQGLTRVEIHWQDTGRNGRFASFCDRLVSLNVATMRPNLLEMDAGRVASVAISRTFGFTLGDYRLSDRGSTDSRLLERKPNPHSTIATARLCALPVISSAETMLSLVRQTDVCREQHASDELHHRIEKIWQARLGLSSIDHAADFFELGGDSLQALEMLYEINDLLGIEVPLTTLFEDKFTIAGLMGIVGATSVAGLD